AQKSCEHCNHVFGDYYCDICHLFDKDKKQYHCDGCGICRIGPKEQFEHCAKCNLCLPLSFRGNHKVRKHIISFILRLAIRREREIFFFLNAKHMPKIQMSRKFSVNLNEVDQKCRRDSWTGGINQIWTPIL
ncbi:hypothetical protein AB205_0108620, partial [Aquarana catesbeiana]